MGQAPDCVKMEQEKLIVWIIVAKIEKCLYKRIATAGQWNLVCQKDFRQKLGSPS